MPQQQDLFTASEMPFNLATDEEQDQARIQTTLDTERGQKAANTALQGIIPGASAKEADFIRNHFFVCGIRN